LCAWMQDDDKSLHGCRMMINHWDESVEYAGAPRIPLMLVGRFKQETGEKVFTQPLAKESKSGVEIMLWFFRTLELLHWNG
jgi:hypothetical protein